MRLCGIPLCVLLVAVAFVLYFSGQEHPLEMLRGVVVMALAFALLLLLIAFVVSGGGTKWFVTDEGLKQRQLFGVQQTIPWAQIYHMAHTERGFFIRWREPVLPGEKVSDEDLEHRAFLYPGKSDADELIALWRQKTSCEAQAEGQTHLRAVTSKTSRQMLRWSLGMIAAGLALICWGAVNIGRHYPSVSWPSVDGKIISQEYQLLPPHPKHSGRDAQLDLLYEYEVAGQIFRADQYSLWHPVYQDSDETIRAFASDHQKGASVKVYYNPKQPAEAVLLTGPDWRGSFALMICGMLLVAVGLLMRSVFLKLRRVR